MIDAQTDQFFQLETSLHKKEVRTSRKAVSALLADDFIEFGKSGLVYTKQQVIDHLAAEENDQEISVSDFSAKELSPAVVLVRYTARMLEPDKGTIVATNRSSIWVYQQEKWQMVFHQGTKLKQ